MNGDTIQQIIRIAMQAGGGIWLGTEIVNGDLYQAAIAGAIQVGAFVWWLVWERNRKPVA
jgi:hypothetical protein